MYRSAALALNSQLSTLNFPFLLLLCSLLLPSLPARACSVPVFRYALERWPASPYELVLFHEGPLSAPQQALVKRLSEQDAATNTPVNLGLRAVEVGAGKVPAELASLWERYKTQPLPLLVLLYPQGAAAQGVVWSGAYSEQAVERILDSPVRRRLAQRLLKGESGVWVFLESGDKSRDEAALGYLKKRLDDLQKSLQLPEVDPDDLPARRLAASDLKLAFSLLRLSRRDPAEQVFVRMLLGSEEDLGSEPIVFPVFGRGRALFALVGKGITDETTEEACSFLIGPCSCVVKEMNPGLDLLLCADWDSALADEPPRELPELSGLDGLQTNAAAPAPGVSNPPPRASVVATVPASAPIRTVSMGAGLLALGGAGALVFLGGLLILLRGKD
jgi:hypothetical protein